MYIILILLFFSLVTVFEVLTPIKTSDYNSHIRERFEPSAHNSTNRIIEKYLVFISDKNTSCKKCYFIKKLLDPRIPFPLTIQKIMIIFCSYSISSDYTV